jgi:DNA-binding transcriptional LysR family regulator
MATSMARKIDWENQIGRRLKLRDLHVFFTVVQRGSMAKAATHLGVSQPAVSEVIGDLEHALGVRLLDRSAHGVELTAYGRALLKRSRAAFDELKQGIKDIEFLANPTAGELRIGCVESIASAILPPVIELFAQQYPRIVLHVTDAVTATPLELPQLRERILDIVLARIVGPLASEDHDLNVEILFDDYLVLVAGKRTRWANRAKIDLAELVNEPWILTPANSWGDRLITDAFRARGLTVPKASLMTFSVHLRTNLLTTGPFITALPSSVVRLHADRFALKVLPIDLPIRPWPVGIVTLKNRHLSPVAQLFIDHLRACATAMPVELQRPA